MTDVKRRTLLLTTGKQIKLFGNSIAIGKTLEIGEGYAPNLFSLNTDPNPGNTNVTVANPHNLTRDELHELADYNIQLWMDFKTNIRKYGNDDPRIFGRDSNK